MITMTIDPRPPAPAGPVCLDPTRIGDRDYLPLADAARSVGVPYDRASAWRRAGHIPDAADVDGRWWIPLDQIQQLEHDLRRVHVHEHGGVMYISPELAAAILGVTQKRVYDWHRSKKLPGTLREGRRRMWVLLDEARTALASCTGRGRPCSAVPLQRPPAELEAGLPLRHRRYIRAAAS